MLSAYPFSLVNNVVVFKNGPFPASFSLFSSFSNTCDSKCTI